jgi:hypothetical protein
MLDTVIASLARPPEVALQARVNINGLAEVPAQGYDAELPQVAARSYHTLYLRVPL